MLELHVYALTTAEHSRPTSTDLVLEEVDSEDDQDQNQDQENRSEQPSSPKQAEPEERSDPEATSFSAPMSCLKQEDAETQTERWTPLIESIKKEAEDNAMATMEERLREERLEMARMAEEVARHAAEVTVRELSGARVTVHTPILEVEEEAELECQELSPVEKFIQEVEEPAEGPEETEEEVEDADSPGVEEPTLPSPEPKILTGDQPDSPEPFRPEAVPAEEPEEPEEEESDSSSEAESEPDPITQQPESRDGASVKQNVTQDEGTLAEEETAVPSRCDALKACLMRVPCAPVCLDRFNQLLNENNITLPQVPPIPKLPSRLSQITQQFPPFLLSLKDFPAGFPTDFPNIHRHCLVFHNTSPTSLSAYPISRIIYPIFLSTCPAFLGSATPLFRIV
ncbi:hypothetical protein PDJAM_G00235550 [Pangasius djambal]|uniref:Uncharacterized protein n=1 Tax=Pangasius djambal TaxID=1691987 RepID=A0ACC5YFH1_9TELE|nr:hypothetical protein [Pangasius djambal]